MEKKNVDTLFSKLKPRHTAYILHVLHRKSPQEAVHMMAEEMIGNFSSQSINLAWVYSFWLTGKNMLLDMC